MCGGELGLDLDALDVDDARMLAAEQRAGDGAGVYFSVVTVSRIIEW